MGKSRFLFTSWECPESEDGTRPEYYCIGGLDEQAALKLLRRLGLKESDSDLNKVIELSGGHPKALILLAQLVNEGEKLSIILDDSTLWKGEVAENILDKVYIGRLSEEERKVLQYVSLYRKPVSAKAIVSVANNPALTEMVVKKMALKLKRKSLLQRAETGDNYWEDSLIQDYAYSKLDDRVERHKLACQYYLSLSLPENRTKKDDVLPLIEACYHACKAEEYDEAASIIFDYKLNEDLERWGEYRTLVELYSGLLQEDHFNENILLSDIRTHSAVIGNLGNVYRNLGEIKKAIVYYEKALKIDREIGDEKGENTWAGNMGISYRFLGEMKEAIEYYNKALNIARKIGDRKNEGRWLGEIGRTYRDKAFYEKIDIDQKEKRKAIELLEEALKIAQEVKDSENECKWFGNIGIVHCDLGKQNISINYFEKALKIAREIKARRYEGMWIGSIGRAYREMGEPRKAIGLVIQGLKIAREIEDRRNEGFRLKVLGNCFEDEKKYKEALACYLMAKNIRWNTLDPRIKEIESILGDFKEKIGEEDFEKLNAEVAPRAEEIVKKILEAS